MSPSSRLQAGLATLGLDLPAETQSTLLAYVALLQKWNRTYNLTAVRDAGEMVTQHLLDSLSLLAAVPEPDLAGRRWADVGSGAGLPGIPLAIVRRDIHMTLIEAVEKKTAFQRQAKIELGLENVSVIGGRVEDLTSGKFHAVVSRAFAELGDYVRIAGHLAAENGRLYAMKGRMPEEEIVGLPPGWAVVNCVKLSVPGTDAERHLIALEKA